MTPIERIIARQCITDLLAAGYHLSVNDGGDEPVLVDSRSPEEILGAMGTTGEDVVSAVIKTGPRNRKPVGWVQFIYGNGCDLISDYTTSLEAAMEKVNALANKIDGASPDDLLALYLNEHDPNRRELEALRRSVAALARFLKEDGEPKLTIPPEGQERGWNALVSAIVDRIEWDRRYKG